MSRATMISSAAAGIPRSPRSVDTKPSCITPPSLSAASSACEMIGRPNAWAYSSARRRSAEFITGRPSSE